MTIRYIYKYASRSRCPMLVFFSPESPFLFLSLRRSTPYDNHFSLHRVVLFFGKIFASQVLLGRGFMHCSEEQKLSRTVFSLIPSFCRRRLYIFLVARASAVRRSFNLGMLLIFFFLLLHIFQCISRRCLCRRYLNFVSLFYKSWEKINLKR